VDVGVVGLGSWLGSVDMMVYLLVLRLCLSVFVVSSIWLFLIGRLMSVG